MVDNNLQLTKVSVNKDESVLRSVGQVLHTHRRHMRDGEEEM